MPRALLLAFSGVRIVDPDLRALGLTLPGFVERGEVIARLPSLGLLSIAAHTPAAWTLAYEEVETDEPEALEALAERAARDFDLVAVSCLSARVQQAMIFAAACRVRGLPTVLGGLHASACPAACLTGFDAVVVGDGEPVWGRLLGDAAEGTMGGIYDGRATPFELSHARVPRFDLLPQDGHTRLSLQTTRGCPLGCSFCGASRLLGPYRKKALAQVDAELHALRARWPRPMVELADDNSFVDRRWAMGLMAVFAAHRFRWFTESDLRVAEDPDLLDAMAAAGCVQLLVGLESPSAAALTGVDHAGLKERWVARHGAAVAAIQSRGIAVIGCFVLGWDQDGPDCFEAVFDAQRDLGLADVQLTVLTPFAGTALHAQLAAQGRLPDPAPWSQCTLFDVAFTPARMSAQTLRDGFRALIARGYAPGEVARRRRIFKDCTRRRLA